MCPIPNGVLGWVFSSSPFVLPVKLHHDLRKAGSLALSPSVLSGWCCISSSARSYCWNVLQHHLTTGEPVKAVHRLRMGFSPTSTLQCALWQATRREDNIGKNGIVNLLSQLLRRLVTDSVTLKPKLIYCCPLVEECARKAGRRSGSAMKKNVFSMFICQMLRWLARDTGTGKGHKWQRQDILSAHTGHSSFQRTWKCICNRNDRPGMVEHVLVHLLHLRVAGGHLASKQT